MANREGLDMLKRVFESMDDLDSMFEDDDSTEVEEVETTEVEDTPDDDNDTDNDPPEIDDGEEIKEDEEDDDNEEDEEDDSILDAISEKVKLSKAEVEILDSLIESEVDAVSDYSKALNETKNRFARKLYTEIISDESKHLSQLKYLKAMGTDSDYIPKDKEANDELAEILESLIEEL